MSCYFFTFHFILLCVNTYIMKIEVQSMTNLFPFSVLPVWAITNKLFVLFWGVGESGAVKYELSVHRYICYYITISFCIMSFSWMEKYLMKRGGPDV